MLGKGRRGRAMEAKRGKKTTLRNNPRKMKGDKKTRKGSWRLQNQPLETWKNTPNGRAKAVLKPKA